MQYHYLFKNLVNDEQTEYQLITIKQISKYKYVLELYKKKSIKQVSHLGELKIGKFLYLKDNKFCIFDAKHFIIKEFIENAEFLVSDESHMNLENALVELFQKNIFSI